MVVMSTSANRAPVGEGFGWTVGVGVGSCVGGVVGVAVGMGDCVGVVVGWAVSVGEGANVGVGAGLGDVTAVGVTGKAGPGALVTTR